MSTTTPNLNLTKPAGNERPDVDVINANMDILDAKIGAVGSTSLQALISALVPYGSLIYQNADVNNLKTTGAYFCANSQNLPSGAYGYGTLLVICGAYIGSYSGFQVYVTDRLASAGSNYGIWVRTFYDGTFNGWVKLSVTS